MKRITVIERGSDGQLKDNVYFAETSKEVKELPGVECVTGSSRVQHPSPEVMARALLIMDVNLVKFYEICEQVKKSLTEEQNADNATG